MKMLTINNKKGITLVEILLSTLILVGGIASALLYFTTAMTATRLARETTIATTHAEYILEEMATRATLPQIGDPENNNFPTWQNWLTAENLISLPNETINFIIPAINYAAQFPWDVNGDLIVDQDDVDFVAGCFGQVPSVNPACQPADVVVDDLVNILDESLVGVHWGEVIPRFAIFLIN